MNNYSTISEAWGVEAFTNPTKKKKKRRKRKERFRNYEAVSSNQGSDVLNANGESIYKSNQRHRPSKNVVRYNSSNRSMNVNRLHRSQSNPQIDFFQNNKTNGVEPIKIKLDINENDYEGYNSSDYEQYAIDEEECAYQTPQQQQQTTEYQNDAEQDIYVRTGQYVEQEEYNPRAEAYEEELITNEEISSQRTTSSPKKHVELDSEIIDKLYTILDRLEKKDCGGENMYDLLLFIFFGIFILFVIDYIYKIGVKTSSNL